MTEGRRIASRSAPTRTFVVSGRVVQVSVRLWERLEGHELVPDGYACNGCSFSPDAWRQFKLWPACVIHDRHYDPDAPLGPSWGGRREADAALRRNLAELLRAQGAPGRLVRTLPWSYWSRVRLYGAACYYYGPGETAEGRVQRLREVYGLFRDRRTAPGVQPGYKLRKAGTVVSLTAVRSINPPEGGGGA